MRGAMRKGQKGVEVEGLREMDWTGWACEVKRWK